MNTISTLFGAVMNVDAPSTQISLIDKVQESLRAEYAVASTESILEDFKERASWRSMDEWEKVSNDFDMLRHAVVLNQRSETDIELKASLTNNQWLQTKIGDKVTLLNNACRVVENGRQPEVRPYYPWEQDADYFLQHLVYLLALKQHDIAAHDRRLQGVPKLQPGLRVMAEVWAQALTHDLHHEGPTEELTARINEFKDKSRSFVGGSAPTADQLEVFKTALVRIMNEVGASSVRCDYRAPGMLRAAAEEAGIKIDLFSFPMKSSTSLDVLTVPGSVSVKISMNSRDYVLPVDDQPKSLANASPAMIGN